MRKNITKLFYPTSLLLLFLFGCKEEKYSEYVLYNGIQGNWLRSSENFQYEDGCIRTEKQTIEFTKNGSVIKREISEYNCFFEINISTDTAITEDSLKYKIDMEDNYIFINDEWGELYRCRVKKLTNSIMQLSITERGNVSSRNEEWMKIKN